MRMLKIVVLISFGVAGTGSPYAGAQEAIDVGLLENPAQIAGQPQIQTCADLGNPGLLLAQDPHDPSSPDNNIMSSHQTTWGTYLMTDSIEQAVDPDWFDVNSLAVWGLSLKNDGGLQECDPTGLTFEVVFYEDNAGQPGTTICSPQSIPATTTDSGLLMIGFTLYRFDIPVSCDLGSVGRKWVTIQSELNSPDCGFVWLSGSGGDATSLQDGGGGWSVKEFDRSLCVNGATVPISLQSFEIN